MKKPQQPLHHLVEWIHIDVRKQLTGEIPDGHAAVGWCIGHQLRSVHVIPFRRTAYMTASIRWVEQYDFVREPQDEVVIYHVAPRHAAIGSVVCHLCQRCCGDVEQTEAVDVHEVAAYVYLQRIARTLPVVRLLSYMLRHALDAVVCATARYARISVLDEGALKQLVRVVVV